MGGNGQIDFLAKENMVRRGVNVSRQRGDIGPSKNYRNALEMVKYQAEGLYGVLPVVYRKPTPEIPRGW